MKVFDIIKKDLRTVLSDKKALVMLMIMPLILTGILSFALKGAYNNEGEKYKTQIAIVKKYNKNSESEEFLKVLKSNILQGEGIKILENQNLEYDEFDVEKIFFKDFLGDKDIEKIVGYRVEDEVSAVNHLKSGEVSAIVVLPEKFIYNMKINMLTPFRNKVDIKVIGPPDKQISAQIIKGMIESFFNTMSSTIIGKNVLLEITMEYDVDVDLFMKMKDVISSFNEDAKNNIRINTMNVEGKNNINSFDYYAVAMMTMFILFTAGQGGRLLFEEKQNITYHRMVIAGTSKLEILAGKYFTIFALGLLQIIIMIIFSNLVLKVQWGNMFLVMLIGVCSSLAVAGVGLLIAVLTYRSGNYKLAEVFNSLIVQIMALLGGSFFPVELLPSFIQKFSFLSLNGISLNSFLKVMRGYGIYEISYNLILLITIGIVFILLAIWLFKTKGGDEECFQ